MHISLPAALLLLAATPALSTCVHFKGDITHDPFPKLSGMNGEVTENGVKVCDGGTFEKDGQYGINCKPGYSYRVTKNGMQAHYKTPTEKERGIRQNAKSNKYGCHRACEDRRGVCIHCTDYEWDIKQGC